MELVMVESDKVEDDEDLRKKLWLMISKHFNEQKKGTKRENIRKAITFRKETDGLLKTEDIDASNGNSLEAHAFLQLLAKFSIDYDFDQKNLSKLIHMVSRRRKTTDMCRSLGLTEKMPGVIDVLVNNGPQVDANDLHNHRSSFHFDMVGSPALDHGFLVLLGVIQ